MLAGAGLPAADRHAGPADEPEQFGDIIVKAGPATPRRRRRADRPAARRGPGRAGRARLQPVLHRSTASPSVGLAIYQLPGTNALDVGRRRPRQDGRAAKSAFPRGSTTASTTTPRPSSASRSSTSFKTLLDAVVLVAIVVLVFLQNWRAALIPLVAVPVAIVGTFAVMAAIGFSLNNISLFGLVLAIGIVVDDAIVVVENVERWLAEGLAAARGGPQGDGRSDRPGGRRGAGAVRGVRALRVHQRHHRPVLPPVRRDDRRLDGHSRPSIR